VSQAIAAHAASVAQPAPTTQPVQVQPPVVQQPAPQPEPMQVQAPQPVAPQPAQPAQPPSPWAPPAGGQPGAMTPAAQAVQAAAPAIAAVAQQQPAPAQVAPAQVAAPKVNPAVTQPGAGGKKKQDAKEKKASKGKFRETMWFKKGDLDAAAAEEAAKSKDANASDKADSLPMEERYTDDGSITTSDAQRYSLKTGHTGAMPAMRDGEAGASSQVSEDELIGEMKGGSRLMLILIAVGVLAVVGIVLAFAL
jgi:hypothetical protein